MRRLSPSALAHAFAVLTLALVAGSAPMVAQSPQSAAGSNPQDPGTGATRAPKEVEGELLVRFRRGTSNGARAVARGNAGASLVRAFRAVPDLEQVRLPQGTSVPDALVQYRSRPDVVYAEPNYVLHVLQSQTMPNDPDFGQLWGLHNIGQSGGTASADIDAPEAWSITTGSSNVVIAVIDTGTDYTHPDLAANMFRNTADCNANGVDDDGNGYVDDCYGIDTANHDGDPMDDHGHGTHTAGTIGAAGNNGLGVVGVNWNVSVMPCKFLNANGSGSIADAVACLDYVRLMKDRGVNIVATSNSWGGGGYSQALYDAIDAQRQRGILFIAAAGNAASNTDTGGFYPAGYDLPNIISVAATTRTDDLAWFSNFGRHTVHVGAPGLDILSTTPNNTYSTFSGTSMATPHVSGVAALLKAADPSRDWRAIKNLILASGDTIPSLSNTVTSKRLNAYNALTCSNSVVTSRLHPASSFVSGTVNEPIKLAMLNIDCANPNGAVSVTVTPGGWTIPLVDDGTGNDQAADDGVYTGEFVPAIEQTYALTFPGGDVVTVAFPQTYSVTPVPYAYRTIAGTNLNLLDDHVAPVTPPFPLSFGGVELPTVFVGDNGVLSFSGDITSYFNLWLPAGEFQTAVAPFWDDIRPSGQQNVYWDVIGTAPHRELVIEWRDLPMWYCPTGGTLTFEAVFFEGSSDILFNYADTVVGGACAWADHGADATVGVQEAPARATQFSFNAATLDDQTALLWTLQPPSTTPAMNVVPASIDFGTVALGTSVDRMLTVQNVGGGTLTGSVATTAPFSIAAGATFSLGAYASQPVVVRFHPTAEAVFTGSVSVVSNATATSVPVTGEGTTQTLAIVAAPTAVTVPIGPLDGIPLSATGGDGTYAWSVIAGALPPGVAIRTDFAPYSVPTDASAGLIGVATTPGTYAFTLRVTSGAETADVSSVVKVTGLIVKDGNHGRFLPEAAVGEAYAYQLTALNGAGPLTWITSSASWMPPGITLDAGGLLSGTPTAEGYYYVDVRVTDGIDTVSRFFTLPVFGLRITTPGVLPNATAGAAYSATMTAQGGVPPYVFTGGCCVQGLNLDSNGTMSGTVDPYAASGVSQVYVSVQDSQGHWYSGSFSLDVIRPAQPLPSMSLYTTVDDCTVGMTCSRGIAVRSGGTAPFTWTATGLPPGTSIRPSRGSQTSYVSAGSDWSYLLTAGDAEVWGVPTASGTFDATVTVTDTTGVTATSVIPFRVSPLVQTGSLPSPTFNVPYSEPVRVIGGVLPYTGTQISGELPAGLTFDSATMRLSGTPVENGWFSAVFEFTDAGGATDQVTENFSIWSPSALTIYPGGDIGTIGVGSNYYNQLYACCGNSYEWSIVDGMPPDGLTLSTSGVLSGTPTTAGSFAFLVRVVDPSNTGTFGQRQLRIRVVSDPLLVITSGFHLTDGNVSVPYSVGLTATGGTGLYSWAPALGSYLPPGLTLSGNGVISGTPAASGQFNFSIAATDGTQTATQSFNVSIYAAGQTPPVSQSQGPDLGTWSIGRVNIPLSASGGNGSYVWSVVAGSLPPGISLRDDPPPAWPGTTLAGVATTPGTYTFALRATSGTAFADQTVTLKVTALSVKDGNAFGYLPDAFVGEPYLYTLTALGAAGPATFASPAGLPPGLTLNADGVLSGSPIADANYWVSFSVTDGVDTIWRGLVLRVNALDITTPGVLPNATRGAAYTATLTATGGTPPYSFHDGLGVPGLTMSLDGTISGTVTPFAPLGPGHLRVEVTDANFHTYIKWMSIDVLGNAPAPPLPDPTLYMNAVALDDCTIGMTCSRGIAVVGGGTAPFTWAATGLPPGLSIRTATGSQNNWVAISAGWGSTAWAGDLEIWGVPTASGMFTVEVTVTDAGGAATTTIYPLEVAALTLQTSLLDGTIDQPYSQQIRPLGGTLPYTGVLSVDTLPAGLTFDPVSLIVSGVPIENAPFNPVFTFTDAGGEHVRLTDSFTVHAVNPGITIFGVTPFANGSKLGSTQVGSPYSYQFAVCCAASYQWSIAGGTVPPGLALNSNGVLSGASTSLGTYTFLVRVEDPSNNAIWGQRQFTLNAVTSLLQVTGNLALPPATLGAPYAAALTATGGDAPLTWARAPFNLPPPGLTFGADGVLSGTPQQSGRFEFAVTVTDGVQTAAATVLLTVTAASPAIVTSLSIASASGVFGGSVTLSATLTASGAPLAGQIISFALNGNAVGLMATDASGVATLPGVSLAGIDAGFYPGAVSATFAGNGAFLPTAAIGDLTVAGPPSITVTSPTEPIYERGSTVLAAYSCGTAATCIGDVANGATIDTSTAGFKSFQVVATDAFGNITTALVTYAVSLGSPISPIAGLSAWLPGDGSTRDLVSGAQAAWSGSEAYAAGKAAQAFSLDGMSMVSLPLAQPGPFTLQSWIRVPNRLQPEFTGIISSGAPGQSAETFQLELDGYGNLRLNVGNNDLSVLIGPAADIFQHVAITFDGTWISVYLNGQFIEREMWTPALGFQVLNIGIDRDALWPFTGLVDEAHVFSRALTDDEVLQTFLAGASGFRKNHAPVAAASATPNPAEATAPGGATVVLDGGGSTDADGDALTYTWSEGATMLGTGATLPVQLSIGSHAITLMVDDGHDTASTGIPVTVVDTTLPAATVTSPSVDAMLTALTSDVIVQASDVVGVSSVLVNGIAATRTSGTAQAGTWRATVPVAPGNALTIGVSAADAAGQTGTATRVVDNDGIPSIVPAALDRNRTTGADQTGVFSSDFNNGVTAGTLVRNGWTTKLSNAPTANGVRVQVSGTSPLPSRVLACVGANKEVRLDAAGETADVTCDPTTGTITVKAVSAAPKIEVWKQASATTWTSAQLPTGAVYSTGSPATAGAANTAPITVNIVQADAAGAPTVVVGQFDLAPGASVDVRSVPSAGGREGVEFRVLRGVIPVRVAGRTHSLKAGSVTIVTIDR